MEEGLIKMLEDILDLNVNIFRVERKKEELYAKYKRTVELDKNFLNFFKIVEEHNVTKEEIKEILNNAGEEIACLYCTAAIASRKTVYDDYFDIMINKLINNSELLYYFLFQASASKSYFLYVPWNAYRVSCAEKERDMLLNQQAYTKLLKPYIKQIFMIHGRYLFNRAKRGYKNMMVFFMLFYPYFTQDMYDVFVLKLLQAAKKATRFDNECFLEFLRSHYIDDFPFNDKLKSILILYSLA